MVTNLKIIDDVVDIVPTPTAAPAPPDFDIAPTRKRHADWHADHRSGARLTRGRTRKARCNRCVSH